MLICSWLIFNNCSKFVIFFLFFFWGVMSSGLWKYLLCSVWIRWMDGLECLTSHKKQIEGDNVPVVSVENNVSNIIFTAKLM